MRTASLVLLTLAVAGCTTVRGNAPSGVVGPTWQLASIQGDVPSSPDASISFGADGTVSGSTGCNRFNGTYELSSDGDLSISPLATTKRACAPAAMDQERRVLDALADVGHVETDMAQLVLFDDEAPLLSFQTPGAATTSKQTLSGTVTYLPRIALPPGAVVTVRLLDVSLADAPSVTLDEETITDERLSVPIPFTLRYDASDVDTRRRYVVRAEIRDRADALLWTTDTAYPVLTNGAPSEGVEVRVVQVAASSEASGGSALVGPEWRLSRIERSSGITLSPSADTPYTITFGTDGRYAGQADCNRYGGSFETATDGGLRLDQGLSTLAACAPPSVSDDFFGVLNDAETYAVSDGRLTLRTSDGSVLVFERDATGGMPPQETGQDFTYTCESPDGPFTFRIRTGPGEIALWLPERFEGRDGGTYRVLGQVRSASGAKYQDGPVTVWTKGQTEALLEVDGEEFLSCQA